MEYWRRHFDDNAQKFNSLKKQVDMTIGGQEVDDRQVELRVDSIVKNLRLASQDVLLDLCCGNGLLTKKISKYVSHIYAIDFSEGLISIAKAKNNSDNITYIIGDITKMDYGAFPNVNKVCLYSCVQYLDNEGLKGLLKALSQLKNILVYMSNIPDKQKIWDYYNTEQKKAFYLRTLKEGKPHIGTWWERNEVQKLAMEYGFSAEFIEINKEINTSYYRFDVILSN